MRVKDAIKLLEQQPEDEMFISYVITMENFNQLINDREEYPITKDEWERIVPLIKKARHLLQPISYLVIDIMETVFDNWNKIRPQA